MTITKQRVEEIISRIEIYGHGAGYTADEVYDLAVLALRLMSESELAMESMREADAAVKLAREKFLSMDDEIQKLRNAYSNEPMAWIHYDNGLGIPAITRSKGIADDWISKGWRVIHLHAKLISESNGGADENMSCDTTAQQFESLAKSE